MIVKYTTQVRKQLNGLSLEMHTLAEQPEMCCDAMREYARTGAVDFGREPHSCCGHPRFSMVPFWDAPSLSIFTATEDEYSDDGISYKPHPISCCPGCGQKIEYVEIGRKTVVEKAVEKVVVEKEWVEETP